MAPKCPADSANPYSEVRSYAGYEYLGRRLASDGYVVISIDANRGITGRNSAPGVNDDGLILARGRLALRHLQTLSGWNATKGASLPYLGVDLYNKLNFQQVGLFGHSRGGEGMRAAYTLYGKIDEGTNWKTLIGPVTFRGVFELAPTDRRAGGLVNDPLNAKGVAWNVLLPACDGDVFNLQGIRPFDRLINATPLTNRISTYYVWGANHNFYNSEWQTTDDINTEKKAVPDPFRTCYSPATMVCVDPNVDKTEMHNEPMFGPSIFTDDRGRRQQQDTALSSVTAFFRSNVAPNGNEKYDANFNPLVAVPGEVVNPNEKVRNYPPRCIERAYSRPLRAKDVFEDFSQSFPLNSHSMGTTQIKNDTGGSTITVVQEQGVKDLDDDTQHVANIVWSIDDPDHKPFFQDNWTVAGKGMDISNYVTLDFRIARQDDMTSNATADTDFTIWLIGSDPKNFAGPVRLRAALKQGFASLTGPGGVMLPNMSRNEPHSVLNTVRIRLSAFNNLANVQGSLRGVQFVFNRTNKGAIYMANITLSRALGPGIPLSASLPETQETRELSEATEQFYSSAQPPRTGKIVSAKAGVPVYSFDGVPYAKGVQLELQSDDPLPMGNAPLTLWIGSIQIVTGNVLGPHLAVFTLTPQQFAEASGGDPVILNACQSLNCPVRWNLGTFDKAAIQAQQ
jgi:hypothetical protein